MENYKNEIISLVSKVDRRHVQIALVVIALSLFVLSAGAPGAWGDHSYIMAAVR
jgi:hypothetical protein